MNEFSVVLRLRDGTPQYVSNNLIFTPVGKMSFSEFGGPDEAEVDVRGTVDEIANMINFLGSDIEIRNENGTSVWWGFINDIDVNVGEIIFSSSLNDMSNRIKTKYSYRDAYGHFASGETSWAEDATSKTQFGTKELIQSIGEGSIAGATAALATLLSQVKNPIVSIKKASARDKSVRAKIKCKGWINILDWKYCLINRGFDEYKADVEKSFLLGFSRTSSTVSFTSSSRKIEDLTYDFRLLESGDYIKITGSASNNSTFKIETVSQNSITVVEALTNEAVGASVTIASPYSDISQIFKTTSSYEVDKISIYVKKIGTPSGSIALDIMTDSAGSPGTILQTATIAAGSVAPTLSSQDFSFAGYSLVSGTSYHMRVKSNATASSANFYRVGYDYKTLAAPFGHGKVFNGSAWVAPFTFELTYVILDKLDTIQQIKAIFQDHGQIFGAINYEALSGVKTNQWRDGKTSSLTEVKKLVDIGSSGGYAIYIEITPTKDVIIKIDNVSNEIGIAIDQDGRFRYSTGGFCEPAVLHVGYPIRLIDMPRVVTEKINSPYVVFTKCEFNFDTGTYDWAVRKTRNKYNLAAITSG